MMKGLPDGLGGLHGDDIGVSLVCSVKVREVWPVKVRQVCPLKMPLDCLCPELSHPLRLSACTFSLEHSTCWACYALSLQRHAWKLKVVVFGACVLTSGGL